MTDSIANKIGGKIKTLIESNKEVQFYANDYLNEYQWRDSRYRETSDIWSNPTAKTRGKLITIFENHLKNKGAFKGAKL